MGEGSQMTPGVDQSRCKRGSRITGVHGHESVGASEKRRGHRFVLVGLARTGAVDQPTAGRHGLCRALQQLQLALRESGEILFASTPLDIRIAAQYAEAGTG